MFNSGNCSVPLVASIDGNGNNNGGWGNDGWGLIWIVLIFAIFGWGNGFGGWGNNGGGMGSTAAAYTDSAIQRGFDNQAVISKLDGITNGLCDGFYAVNNSMLTGFNGINTNIMQTGYGIQQAINADTVANMQNTNALQAQLAQCCCDNKEALSNTNYNMATQANAIQQSIDKGFCQLNYNAATNTRDIIDNQNAGTRAVLDYLCAKENADLRDKVQKLELAASQSAQNAYITANQEAQTAELIRRINPAPVPSYTVPAPYPYAGYGCNAGCNC